MSTLIPDNEEKEKYYELLKEVRMLESSDRDLRDKLTELESADKQTLLVRIAELERSEKGTMIQS